MLAAAAYLVLSFGIVVGSGPLAATGWLTYALYPAFAVWLLPATTVMVAPIGKPPGSQIAPAAHEAHRRDVATHQVTGSSPAATP